MAEQRVIVVTEVAPRLKDFTGPEARKFLRDYVAYENRIDTTEAQTPLRRCLEPEDLETLLQCSEDMAIEVVRQAAAPPVAVAPTAAGSQDGASSSSARATAAPTAVAHGTRARASVVAPSRDARRDIQTPIRTMPGLGEERDNQAENQDQEEENAPDQVVWMSNAHPRAGSRVDDGDNENPPGDSYFQRCGIHSPRNCHELRS